MTYYGDFATGSVVQIPFNSSAADGTSITLATNGTIRVYKGSSTTQRTSANGITFTEDFDTADTAAVGIHMIAIDLSDNSDAGFYAAGNNYHVAVTGMVIDGVTVSAWVGSFSIQNRVVASVQGNVTGSVGSVTGAVGSVTGNVGGNVTGSVGSVTGNVGGNVTGSVGSVAADGITASSIATDAFGALELAAGAASEIAAAVWDRAIASHTVTTTFGGYLQTIGTALNANDLTSKTADSGVVTTGTNTSGTYSDTASDNAGYWITAPVTPAVGGFGLRQTLVFNMPTGRVPVSIRLNGYWNGSSNSADVYAYNVRTAVYDKLTNSSTNLASRSSDITLAIPLPRDYCDDNGVTSDVLLELRSTSTNTAHRLRIDQALVYHISEGATFNVTTATPEQIWTYISRTLTTPGEEPVVVDAAAIAAAVSTEIFTAPTTDYEASAPAKSLGSAVMKLLHRSQSASNVFTVYRSDATTAHLTQSETTNNSAKPIVQMGDSTAA